jgi:hypothetical protein
LRRHRRSAAVVAAPAGVDRRIALLATHQDGIVERRQLIAIGLSAAAIDHRVRSGRLIVLYRGVYAVGHAAQSERGTLRAALMAAGPTAAHSHLTAAARWKLIPSMPQFVEVTVTRKGPRSRRGLRIHETQRPLEIRILDSLPLTAPLRTLTDLARTQSRKQLERMCAEALVMKLVTQDKLDAAGILDPYLAAPTRSEFERRFYAQLRKARLPRPIAEGARRRGDGRMGLPRAPSGVRGRPRARCSSRRERLGRRPGHLATALRHADARHGAARADARPPHGNAGGRSK